MIIDAAIAYTPDARIPYLPCHCYVIRKSYSELQVVQMLAIYHMHVASRDMPPIKDPMLRQRHVKFTHHHH